MAAGWTGQELAQTYKVRVGVLIESLTANDEFLSEISDMGDRSAEAGNAQPQKDEQNLERRADVLLFLPNGMRRDRHCLIVLQDVIARHQCTGRAP